MNLVQELQAFTEQSKRVIAITHKPKQEEYKQMSFTTAIGMALIGATGFAIAMIAVFLRGGTV